MLSAATTLRALLLPRATGALARLAEAVLGVSLLELTLELLGTIGLLSLVPVVVASLAVGAGVRWGLARRARAALRRDPGAGVAAAGDAGCPGGDREARRRTAWGDGSGRVVTPGGGATLARLAGHVPLAIALLGAGAVLAEWSGITLQALHQGAQGLDSLTYHLPWAASFAHTGQITSIRYTDVDWLTGFYPASSELIQALGIVLMGNDVLAPVLNLGWLALALLAAWCIGARRGAGPATLLAGAVAMATPMMFYSTPGSADSDAMGVFVVLAATALWMNVPVRAGAAARVGTAPGAVAGAGPGETADPGPGGTGRPRRADALAVIPAAAAVGLALAIKLNLVIPALALTAAAIAGTAAGERRRLAGTWVLTAAITGGYWYLRNLIAVGNPLPYFRFGVLPVPRPGPLQAPNNRSIADYAGNFSGVWHFLHHSLQADLGPWWLELTVVSVVGALLCVAAGPGRRVRLLGLVAVASMVGYVLTPGSASGPFGHPLGFEWNLRYSTPALVLALAAAALCGSLAVRRARWLGVATMAVLLVTTLSESRLWGPGYSLGGQLATAAVVLLVGLAALSLPWPEGAVRARGVRLAALTVAVSLGAAGVAFAYRGERTYLHGRYRSYGRLTWVTMLWRWANTVHHTRIAMAGTYGWYFAYPVYGPDDSNTVVYLGRHGPHGSFTPYRTCEAFRAAVNHGHFTYLVTTVTRGIWVHNMIPAPEGGWVSGDPNATRILPHHGGAYPIEVWRLDGPLAPRCAGAR